MEKWQKIIDFKSKSNDFMAISNTNLYKNCDYVVEFFN